MDAYSEYKEHINKICKKHAHKPAFMCISDDGNIRELSYSALYETIIAFKITMELYHLKAGDRVIILDNHSPSVMRTFLSATYWNLTPALLDVGLPEEEIHHFIDFLDVRAVFTNEAIGRKLPENVKKRLPILDLRKAPCSYPEISGFEEKAVLPDTIDPDRDVIAIILSSGTTSRMKAVQITYDSMFKSAKAMKKIAGFKDNITMLFVFPLFHISGLAVAMVNIFYGHTMQMVDTFSPVALPNVLQTCQPTVFGMVPKVFEVMAEKMRQKIRSGSPWVQRYYRSAFKTAAFFNRKLGMRRCARLCMRPFSKALFGKKMRLLGAGASPCDPLTAEVMINMGLVWMFIYASTEAGVPITMTGYKDRYAVDTVGMVNANPYADIMIHKPDIYGVGEIYVKTQMIMKGYFREPELTRAAFDGDYFKTGDLGYIDRNGYLHITGRVKETILLHTGKKVAPEDLETLLIPVCDGQCELAVCGVTDAETGFDKIHVFLADSEFDQDKKKVLSDLVMAKGRKDAPMYPIEQVHFIEAIPKTAIGKVKRYVLKETLRTNAAAIPQTEQVGENQKQARKAQPMNAKAAVSEVLRKYVDNSKMIRDDARLDEIVKLDSLRVFEICCEIEDRAAVKIGTEIIAVKTVADLIALVEKKQQSDEQYKNGKCGV